MVKKMKGGRDWSGRKEGRRESGRIYGQMTTWKGGRNEGGEGRRVEKMSGGCRKGGRGRPGREQGRRANGRIYRRMTRGGE